MSPYTYEMSAVIEDYEKRKTQKLLERIEELEKKVKTLELQLVKEHDKE